MAKTHISEDNSEFASRQRQNIFITIIVIFSALFILRLGWMQIVKGSTYRFESEAQSIKQVVAEPFRGDVYDRNGDIIVNNEPSFTLTITKNDFSKESLMLLASILEIDTTDVTEILAQYKDVSKFTPIRIFRDLDFNQAALIEEYSDLLTGVEIIVDSKRRYNISCNMAHLLGYAREISQNQLKKASYYRPGDLVGQTGLEYEYEQILRGNKGIKFVAINKLGKKVASFNNGKNDIPSSNGFDLYLTIDKKLQTYAESLLKGRRGAIVAINPNNGEILAIASKPDYNPREFSGKISPKIYQELMDDPAKPLYNRSLMAAYPPGSTWKMLVALAALQEGIITPNTTFTCRGSIKLGSREFKCHGAHGAVSVQNAIKFSCNVFFYEVAMKLGLEKLEKYAKMFGFGDRTEIDLPNESSGKFPTVEWANKKFGVGNLPLGYLVNYGIGQGEISATPLQMAVYVATLANKGTVYQPHIVRYVHNNVTNKVEPIGYDSKKIIANKEYFDLIQRGMYDVVNAAGGTASSAQIPGIKVCGKTGTAQNPHGLDHSWFICFAPKDNPQIALCVFVENAGFGGAVAAPIAKSFLSAYFYPDVLKQITNPSATYSNSSETDGTQLPAGDNVPD